MDLCFCFFFLFFLLEKRECSKRWISTSVLSCVIRCALRFFLLNVKKENSNSSVIKLWVIMKDFRLMPGHSPLIAAAARCCKTPKEPRIESLTHIYRCYLRWLAYQTCACAHITRRVGVLCRHPAAVQYNCPRLRCLFWLNPLVKGLGKVTNVHWIHLLLSW